MRAPFGKRLQRNVIDLRDMGLQMMPGPGWSPEAKWRVVKQKKGEKGNEKIFFKDGCYPFGSSAVRIYAASDGVCMGSR